MRSAPWPAVSITARGICSEGRCARQASPCRCRIFPSAGNALRHLLAPLLAAEAGARSDSVHGLYHLARQTKAARAGQGFQQGSHRVAAGFGLGDTSAREPVPAHQRAPEAHQRQRKLLAGGALQRRQGAPQTSASFQKLALGRRVLVLCTSAALCVVWCRSAGICGSRLPVAHGRCQAGGCSGFAGAGVLFGWLWGRPLPLWRHLPVQQGNLSRVACRHACMHADGMKAVRSAG